jgi:outer membrane receptor protein involved in Fe transport
LTATSAAAQQAAEQVTVTGTKLPEAVGSGAFSSTTLTQEQLSTADRLDLALEQVPGLSLFRRTDSVSANASTQGVSLRAIAPSGAGRALVLLDGIPLNDPFGGWVIWTALPYEDIGSAEVIRGAGAGPYGAGALTGTILLNERAENTTLLDVQGGPESSIRAGGSDGVSLGGVDLFGSASVERSNGWVPVHEPDRGAADNHVWFDGGSGSLRGDTHMGDVLASARVAYYDEGRGAGLVDAHSAAHGLLGSLTFSEAPGGGSIGWRLQGWTFKSAFSNTSVSVAPGRTDTTPANDQFATPALGVGFNAALLGESGAFHWEAGADMRDDAGESNELFSFNGTNFTMYRRSGGREIVGGVYGEGAYDIENWLLTLGVREDYWSTSQGHLVQQVRATGAITTDNDYPGKDGYVPTARGGVRYNFSNDEDLRMAGYAGFRVPTLNELYRPFRVGNVTTQANADLTPEKLYGAELGWGGASGSLHWDATAFWNELHHAIANVTIAPNTQQRQNAGDVQAFGLEGQVTEIINDDLSLWTALSYTDAQFVSGQLDHLRPAQAPRTVVTGGATWRVFAPLTVEGQLHWEGMRFEDDQNTLKLGSAFILDLTARYALTERLAASLQLRNVTNADVATQAQTDPSLGTVISYGQPRTLWIGLTYAE